MARPRKSAADMCLRWDALYVTAAERAAIAGAARAAGQSVRAAPFRREPPPEILRGNPVMARGAIRLAPGALKYRSAVLSYAAEDIDTLKFNAGDPALRGAVSLALALCLVIGFAGVPVRFSASPTADVP
jgi:hypothetical protein